MKAIIFDLDDTLYQEHDYVRSGFKAVAKVLATKFTELNAGQVYEEFLAAWHKNGRGKVFDVVCELHGLEVDIALLVEFYRKHLPTLSLYSDAIEILAWLKEKHFQIGIITDGHSTMQWQKIEALGLREIMDGIVVTDDLGADCWKPSVAPYLKVAEMLEVSVKNCFYVGDNPHKDFITAKKLGMHTVRIIRPVGDHMQTRLSEEYEADLTISMLTELIPLLD